MSEVHPIFDSLVFSTWTDYTDTSGGGSEIVSWGLQAINADDSGTSSNNVYVVDGWLYMPPELNVIAQGSVNTIYAPTTETRQHAKHVAGIIGAKKNGAVTRGVNQNNPIVSVLRGPNAGTADVAFDWAFRHAEDNNIHAVLNISSNSDGPPGFSNEFARQGILGRFVERASARLFIAQSAGNQAANACSHAYDHPEMYDGIMVVGGTDEDDEYGASYDNSHVPPYGASGSSNYGGCVDIWAPSKNIYSDWHTSGPQYLSGTSMAAPHIAALAARYGGTTTTSLQREMAINSWRTSTGNADPVSGPIEKPWYGGATTVHPRLWPIYATASSTYPGFVPANAYDGLYADHMKVWNSGNVAPGWIQFDLGAVRNIKAIRMFPEQYPYGWATHQIYYGNTSPASTLYTTVTENSSTLSSIVVQTNFSARYVRVRTTISSAHVAWREVEFYGN